MYTVIRNYTGSPGLANDLKNSSKEIETLISGIPGFVAYYFMSTPEGGASVTVCEGREGCEASTRLAGDWLRQNRPNLKLNPPQIISGDVSINFTRTVAKV